MDLDEQQALDQASMRAKVYGGALNNLDGSER